MEQVREKDRTIRKLNKEIDRLKQTINHLQNEKQQSAKKPLGSDMPIDLSMFEAEINRANRLEEIIQEMTERVNGMLTELSQEDSLTENTQ